VTLEILKILASLLGGGLVGSLVTILYNRRLSRLQKILLIERVNQLVTADLEGITLARRVGGYHSDSTQIEPVSNVREYQLSLRNTSNLHLRDAEIQFEFDVEDVLARTQRPALSKTPLVQLEAVPAEPWKKAFKWKIPHFPVGDSVEFTFQAVESPTGGYEVALYNADRAIVKRVSGEPASKERYLPWSALLASITGLLLSLAAGYVTFAPSLSRQSLNRPTESTPPSLSRVQIAQNGCFLAIRSQYDEYKSDTGLVFRVWLEIYNDGEQDCTVQLDPQGETVTIKARYGHSWNTTAMGRPTLANKKILVGTDRSNLKAVSVQLF